MKKIIKKVLDRHTNSQANMASESFRDMLAVEIEVNLDKHLTAGIKEHLAKNNPLSIEMWKGYKPTENKDQMELKLDTETKHFADDFHEGKI